ncbi:MAG: 6,7-dimethyl-8-ribityllumazine synthase [Chitinophagaceae bacterium]|jgi:6,7-dimethyl-8-ribityllumazine synthase
MIAIVKSDFNTEITSLLLQGCEEQLQSLGIEYKTFTCPGAVETVAYSKFLIDKNQFESIIVIGAIIKGDTDHYEYVCQFVTQGISQLSAQSPIPIIFGILTTQNEELAMERASLDRMNKGKEFADTAVFMVNAFSNFN